MDLQKWLDSQKQPSAQRIAMAAAVGVNLATIYKWERGKRRIDHRHIKAVSEFTGGAVTAADMRPDLAEAMRA